MTLHTDYVTKLRRYFLSEGYEFLSKRYELNLIGIRSADEKDFQFNDLILLVYKNHYNEWMIDSFEATTDPGKFYLYNPINTKGTAYLKPGQYKYKLGVHKGYLGLIQDSPVTVFRVNNRNDTIEKTIEDTGWFGINIHRAHRYAFLSDVNKWSAGCQVIADPLKFDYLIEMVSKHHERSTINYTLIEENKLQEDRWTINN